MASFPYRTACITGASRGIGRAFAERLAQLKVDLVLCARNEAKLQQFEDELRQRYGVRVVSVAADLATSQGRGRLVAAASAEPIDLLINNAGSGLGGAFQQQDPAALRQMLELNVVGATELCRRLLPTLLQRDSAIVQLASQAAFFAMPYMGAYAASKAYMLHLSEAMAHELKGTSVHVMALCPGPTSTDFFTEASIDVKRTRLSLVPVSQVIDEGLRALQRRERVHVVGTATRLQTRMVRFLPRSWVTKMGAIIMRRQHS